jgi:hypothetical protein
MDSESTVIWKKRKGREVGRVMAMNSPEKRRDRGEKCKMVHISIILFEESLIVGGQLPKTCPGQLIDMSRHHR